MHYMMRQLLETFRGLTAEKLAETANVKLSLLIIRNMVPVLNVTPELAAGLVGEMEIKVSDDAYNAEPEAFNEIAAEMVRVMGEIYKLMVKELNDERAAFAYVRSVAKGMSLTYG